MADLHPHFSSEPPAPLDELDHVLESLSTLKEMDEETLEAKVWVDIKVTQHIPAGIPSDRLKKLLWRLTGRVYHSALWERTSRQWLFGLRHAKGFWLTGRTEHSAEATNG